jgi:predicted nuclease of restriction endonuclease-like (RecB) superfamily
MSKKVPKKSAIQPSLTTSDSLLAEVCALIDQAREKVARQVNTELVILNWSIGERIRHEILQSKRAEYGKQVLTALASRLTAEYGRGFDKSALSRMVRFAELFPDRQIVATLSQKLGWSHFRELLPLEEELRRSFYAEMCFVEGWSVRTLQDKIKRLLFERTAIAKKPDHIAKQELKLLQERGELTPDLVFRDPYLLDFLGLTHAYDEKDLEDAILHEMEQFLLELGTHFSFVSRQKRIIVDGEDFYLDLLFYHRKLRRLVAIELKLGSFKPEHKGQMELYLRWLDRHDRCAGEEAPIGLILCAGQAKSEQIELLGLNDTDIRVAEIVTEELPKSVLAQKFHEAIQHARERISPDTGAK